MSDDMDYNMDGVVKGAYYSPINKFHAYYIGDIGTPENYTEWFEQIRRAPEGDIIKFYINSSGGNGFTAIQFLRAMAESKATIIASVEGQCASAATMIFLAAGSHEITPHSIFVFHNYSGSANGKGSDMFDQINHMQQWSDSLLQDLYKNFLTTAEIKTIMEGKDFYMNSEEVRKRLIKRNELSVPHKKKRITKKTKEVITHTDLGE